MTTPSPKLTLYDVALEGLERAIAWAKGGAR